MSRLVGTQGLYPRVKATPTNSETGDGRVNYRPTVKRVMGERLAQQWNGWWEPGREQELSANSETGKGLKQELSANSETGITLGEKEASAQSALLSSLRYTPPTVVHLLHTLRYTLVGRHIPGYTLVGRRIPGLSPLKGFREPLFPGYHR